MDTAERSILRKKVLDFLEAHGINYELYEHPEFCSVADGLEYWKEIHGLENKPSAGKWNG